MLPPATIDGPGADVDALGGVAIATDGSGGLVYVKAVGGAPHVFAARFQDGVWSAPLRVDAVIPYEASEPVIAAGPHGELLVVWVTQTVTLDHEIQRGLYSARLAPGSHVFGPALLIDPEVGTGSGVAPSLSRTAPGQAILVYRAITNDELGTGRSFAVQLRPGDVLADVRLAKLSGETWSRIGALNRNPAASMRPPGPANGPQVAATPDGNAVIAWQEPDQTGVARVWMRRIFGSSLGPVLSASPSQWEGRSVADDADAFSLSVTRLGMAKLAVRVRGGGSSPLGGDRILLSTLPIADDPAGGSLGGPTLLPGTGAGTPSVAAADDGQEGTTRVGFTTGQVPRVYAADDRGATDVELGPALAAGGRVEVGVGVKGGGVAVWPTEDAHGRPALAVRQDFASGAAQTALLAGPGSGPIAQLLLAPSEAGEGLIAYRQGETGRFRIVADRVTVPPARFDLHAPARWVRPAQARLSWTAPASTVGGLGYDVLLDGRAIVRGLARRRYRPRPRLLSNGVGRLQVLATDELGQQVLSRSLPLKVDARAPRIVARLRGETLKVALRDGESGARRCRCLFGDGDRGGGRKGCRHVYDQAGIYPLRVESRDKAGNRTVRRFEVRVR